MDTNHQKNELYILAQKKVQRLKGFYIHTMIFIIGIVLFLAKTYFGAPLNFFLFKHLNWLNMLIWLVVYLIFAFSTFIEYFVFGKKWEERKIKEFLNSKK